MSESRSAGERRNLRGWLRTFEDAMWVPLFDAPDLTVRTMERGRSGRRVLCRAPAADAAIIEIVERGLQDPKWRGLLYVMCWGTAEEPYPLYIGKAGRYGHDGESTSANLANIRGNQSKFARWGYGNAYHIGDLSQVLFGWESYKAPSPKYEAWAELLFESRDPPVLREPAFLMLVPWYEDCVGLDGANAMLDVAEEQAIELGLLEYPDTVLNVSGEVWWRPAVSPVTSSEPLLQRANPIRWVETDAELEDLLADLSKHRVVAVDVETTLHPSRLRLLQLGTTDFNALIDPLRVRNLDGLAGLLASPDVVKVIHNAAFERRILSEHGLEIHRVFDTLSISRRLRRGEKGHALAEVARREIRRSLDKGEQTSDWSRRPLTDRQMEYAALDVEVLLRLYSVFAPETEPTLPLLDLPALPELGAVEPGSWRPLHIFGELMETDAAEVEGLFRGFEGLAVSRSAPSRSAVSHPQSTDLELALKAGLEDVGFSHHVRLEHPRTGGGFEYDFWRDRDGFAIEVMGYRADDEVYKDILKFHVHSGTRVALVLVPRWKWISSRKTETNLAATLKALAFTETFLNVDAVVALAYDWAEGDSGEFRLLLWDQEP